MQRDNSTFITVILVCLCAFLLFDRFKGNSDNTQTPVTPDTVKTVSDLNVSFFDRMKLAKFHKSLAEVLQACPDRYGSLSDFQRIYETSRKLCLKDISANTDAVGIFVCNRINTGLTISSSRQLSTKLSKEDKDKLVAILFEVSNEFKK